MKMYCLNCNKLYDSSDKFCHICGNKLEDELGCYAVQFLKGDQNAVEKIYRCTAAFPATCAAPAPEVVRS